MTLQGYWVVPATSLWVAVAAAAGAGALAVAVLVLVLVVVVAGDSIVATYLGIEMYIICLNSSWVEDHANTQASILLILLGLSILRFQMNTLNRCHK